MATAWVTEFEDVAKAGAGGIVPCGQAPPITTQVITYTTAAVSAAFNRKTKLVRVYTSGDARIAFGTAQVAVAASIPTTAKYPEHFGVDPGSKISVYDGVS